MELTGRYSDCFCATNIYTLTVIDLFEQESKHRQTITVIGDCGSGGGSGSGTGSGTAPVSPPEVPTSTPKVLPG